MHRIFSMLLSGACAAAVSSFVFAVAFALFMRARLSRRRKARRAQKKDALSVSFLHPECLSGGGGERVLWVALVAVRNALPHAEIAVCAPWPAAQPAAETLAATRERVSAQFHIDVPVFHPVRVSAAALTDAARYPRFTLVLQALGAAALGLEAYAACEADVFIDTANQAFSLVPAKLLGAVTMTYIHYPTISADMLAVVRARKPQFNNAGEIARSRALSYAKLLYYRAFAALYSAAGRAADVRMVNSSWTRAHIGSIWSHVPSAELTTVFPPCDTSLLSSLAIEGSKRTRGLIISVGQFRPEKNHRLQLEIMHKLVHSPAYAGSWRIAGAPKPKLIMIGSARHAADVGRVRALCEERSRLGLEGFVEVRANASWDELIELLSAARVGLHTMRDEHFGISIVELQAAGVVPVAHRSGGVALDIIEDGVSGFLAGDADEYALRLHQLLTGADGVDVARIRNVARERTPRFSDDVFVAKFGASCTRAAGLAVG